MQKTRVLAIDDEEIVLQSVERILAEEGFQIDLCSSGKEGLNLALANEYDLVLSDIRMPEIGGMRILRDIKRAKPSTPVVIFTGYGTVQSAVQAMKLGATDYIEKPFTPDLLAETVKKAISASKTQQPEAQSIIHRDEVVRVLEKAATDGEFVASLFYEGAEALSGFDLTGPEKLAILTGDIRWIEEQIGKLTASQKRWLEQRLSAEIW